MPTFVITVCDYSLCFKVYFVEYKYATSAFCCFPFSWNIFCVFTFSLCVSLRLVWVSYRQHRDAQRWVSSFKSVQPVCVFRWKNVAHPGMCLLTGARSAGSELVSGSACWWAHAQLVWSWFLVALQPLSGPSFCSRSVPLRSDDSLVLCLASLLIMCCAFTIFFCFVVTMRLTYNNLYL